MKITMAAAAACLDKKPIRPSSWPTATPHPAEGNILSIVSGNSRLHWALHEGYNDEFHPILFWRTSTITQEDLDEGGPCGTLDRYIPEGAKEVIFGSTDAPKTPASIAAHAATKRIPALSVYIISVNAENEVGISFLFQNVPCNLYRMQRDDFFSADKRSYETIGIDRLACLKAACHLYHHPTLVIDGGTAMTFTVADQQGRCAGGGILPGIRSKFRAMADHAHDLPLIEPEQLKQLLATCRAQGQPLPLVGGDSTESAMVGAVMKETASSLWSIVRGWLEQVRQSEAQQQDGDGKKKEYHVAITGGDAELIHDLLQPDHGHLVQPDPANAPWPENVSFHRHKHLMPHAVQVVLCEKLRPQESKGQSELVRETILGQRVVKEFEDRPDYEGDTRYRGSVISIKRGGGDDIDKDLYEVLYDDGDREDFSPKDLYDALNLYVKVREKHVALNRREAMEEKNLQAKKAAKTLAKYSKVVKRIVESTQKKKSPSAAGGKRSFAAEDRASAVLEQEVSPRKKLRLDSGRAAAALQQKPAAAEPEEEEEEEPPMAEPVDEEEKPAAEAPVVHDGAKFVNRRIGKYFDDDLFFGTVIKFAPFSETEDDVDLWHVLYDDGDREDLDRDELEVSLQLREENKALDTDAP